MAASCSSGSGEGTTDAEPTASATATPEPNEALGDNLPTPTPAPPPANAIKVGVLLDVGNLEVENRDPGNVMSPLDRPAAIAVEAAIEALDDAGGLLGRPVSVQSVDTTSRLSVIDREAGRMIDDGVDLLVVTCEFDFAKPAIDRAEEAGILVISPCAGETGWATGDAGRLAFSRVPSPDTYGRAMAGYAWDQGFRTAAVLSDGTAPEATEECDAFRDEWRTLGGSFSFDQSFGLRAAEALDENPDVAQVGDADVIVVCAFRIIGFELMLQLRLLGIETIMLASPSLDTGNWLPLDIANAAEGAADLGDFRLFTLASVWGDDPSPKMQAAIDQYFESQDITPNSGRFVVGADLVDVWAAAVRSAGSVDGTDVAGEIRRMRDIETVSGALSFAGDQAPMSRELRVMRHNNGTYVFEQLVTAERRG